MKGIQRVLFSLSVVLIASTGCASEKNIAENLPESPQSPQNTVISSSNGERKERYLLIAEEEYLNLYKLDGRATLKKSEQVNFKLFPEADVRSLEEGVEYETPQEAFAAMENFVG